MDEQHIFDHLFEMCTKSKDPDGAVAACLVQNGHILISSPCADDGVRHAEDLLLTKAKEQNIQIDTDTILYTTLEPCSKRSPRKNIRDCTTLILAAGIRHVVFAAPDPEFSMDARKRFVQAGISYSMVNDKEITQKAIEVFNRTITSPLTYMGTLRAKTI
jgi:pyrimidine deaminase RibD-like protein